MIVLYTIVFVCVLAGIVYYLTKTSKKGDKTNLDKANSIFETNDLGLKIYPKEDVEDNVSLEHEKTKEFNVDKNND
ncbi:hypothetical protein [Mycoplasma sp. P36-A1]|uniref:hypothetical protein n=1 Tax=Mycoplasma sp. P36-A1 TaxID=3252900 RepID=UPI003C2E2193